MKPIYLVQWEDSETEDGWPGESDWDKGLNFPLVTSIGWLIKESDKGIVLAISYDPDGDRANPIIFIPYSCIKKMEEIELE